MARDLREPVLLDPELLAGKHEQLTPRQRQILELLKAGKVNKEIANELGIGLGTVKQHMVALFKRLNVRNRTMAVSQGISREADAQHTAEAELVVVDGMLERRPCVVLSVILPAAVSPEALQDLQQSLTAFALANDALLLMRKENSVELIFGVQLCTEFDVYKAYHAAYKVYEILSRYSATADRLKAGITGGMAIVSMQRHGGCTGEVIASPVIGLARELADKAMAGTLILDAPAMALLQLVMPGINNVSAELRFTRMHRMPWPETSTKPPALWGRDEELAALQAWLTESRHKRSPVKALVGETGMGKSLLCRHLAEWYQQQGGQVYYVICQAKNLTPNLYQFPGGLAIDVHAFIQGLQHAGTSLPELVIVDDSQHLKPESLETVIQQSFLAKHKKVLLAGRRFSRTVSAELDMLKLGRLPDQVVQQMAAYYLAETDSQAGADITRQAQGVPLFARLLAQYHSCRDKHLPFALRVVIVARMDSLHLDRAVLAQIGRSPESYSLETLIDTLHESSETMRLAVEKAIASGVLLEDAQQQLRFTHPLLRQAVVESLVE